MSYCRYGNDSDLYIYDDGNRWECVGCKRSFATLAGIYRHVKMHILAGDAVPERCVKRIEKEMAEAGVEED